VGNEWFGSALGQLANQYQGYQNDQHINKVFAANPEFAKTLYGAKNDQSQLALLARQTALKEAAAARGFSSDVPSAIQEYEYFSKLSPEEQSRYLLSKRSNQMFDRGGSQVVLDSTGRTVREIDKTIPPEQLPETKAAQTTAVNQAEFDVEKENAAPKKVTMIDNNLKVINDALAKPGFDKNFGKMGALPNMYGSEAADAATYIDQIRGGAFLTAVGEMKGSGALSDAEGKAATAAVTRLQSSQSAKSAREALADLKSILENAKGNAVKGTSLENGGLSGQGSGTRITVFNPNTRERFTIPAEDLPQAQAEGFNPE